MCNLAIIIPYYKLTFFKATLLSLANQTDKRFKVYIGDDASPEDCNYLISEFKGYFDFVYHRFDTNLGSISLTQQWERCISLSVDEEWIMILGDDDVLGDNVVSCFYELEEKLNEQKNNVLKFASILIDECGKSISKIYSHPIQEKTTEAYYKHYTGESRSSLSEYIFRRTSYNQFKFTDFPIAWHADDKAWLDFTDCGAVSCCNEAIIQIRLSSENISGKKDNILLKRKARMLFLEHVIKDKLSHFTYEQKKVFLFDFGILLKELDAITSKRIVFVFFKFFLMGSFYDSLRFLRRMYWIK